MDKSLNEPPKDLMTRRVALSRLARLGLGGVAAAIVPRSAEAQKQRPYDRSVEASREILITPNARDFAKQWQLEFNFRASEILPNTSFRRFVQPGESGEFFPGICLSNSAQKVEIYADFDDSSIDVGITILIHGVDGDHDAIGFDAALGLFFAPNPGPRLYSLGRCPAAAV